ncbi:MAG: hypothetical protein IH948_01390 [Bacteroidetes bacterium]|nr:hypothetical protein [Bacteroidota bacterium]
MNFFQDKDRRKGLVGTIIFHLILLLMFIFLGMTHTEPIEDVGFKIIFGYEEDGLGEETPTESSDVSETVPVDNNVETPTNDPVEIEDVMTDDTGPVTVKDRVEKTQKKEVVEKVEPEQRVSDNLKNLLEQVKNRKTTSDSRGETETGGVAGNLEGGETGSPIGGNDGTKVSLLNRKSKLLPRPESNIQEEGKLVVSIKVDRNGNVVWAKARLKGSTISDLGLRSRAEAAAYKAKFSADMNAAEEQMGTITYIFVLN